MEIKTLTSTTFRNKDTILFRTLRTYCPSSIRMYTIFIIIMGNNEPIHVPKQKNKSKFESSNDQYIYLVLCACVITLLGPCYREGSTVRMYMYVHVCIAVK